MKHEKFKNVYNFVCSLQNLIFIFQGLEPPKPARVRPPPKPKAPKKAKPPATLRKPVQTPRVNIASRSYNRPPRPSSFSKKTPPTSRTLQATDLEKLSRLNCSREFSLFHQSIKSELAKSYENQLGFLQTKLQHLKNEFENKHGEHLNLEQIKEYYNQAVNEHVRRKIKPDEFLTLSEKFQQDIKQVIEKENKSFPFSERLEIFCSRQLISG